MTLIEAIEIAKYSPEKRGAYSCALLACLIAILLFSTGWTQGAHARLMTWQR